MLPKRTQLGIVGSKTEWLHNSGLQTLAKWKVWGDGKEEGKKKIHRKGMVGGRRKGVREEHDGGKGGGR